MQKPVERSIVLPKILPPPPKPDYGKCKIIDEQDRLDCFPENGPTSKGVRPEGVVGYPLKRNPKWGFP
mgnify:CR=1 FL=1